MTKIAVLGANGTVAQHIVPALLQAGHQVFAASRSGKSESAAVGVSVDFAEPDTFVPLFQQVETAYVMLPTGNVDIEAKLLPIIDIAAKNNVKVVFQSVFGVDADDSIPYRKIELALIASGIPYVILRPNWFMDNFHTFWLAGIKHGELALPAGDARTSFIDARDIADSAVVALTTNTFDNQAFDLTGAEALSYAEAVAIISHVINKPIRYEASTADSFIDNLINAGVDSNYAHFLAAIFEPVAAGFTAAVTQHVALITGHKPRSLNDYLSAHASKFSL